MKTVRFDDSLPILTNVIRSTLGDAAMRDGTVLRDAAGCLAFFSAAPLDEITAESLSATLRDALGAYARSDRVIAGSDDYGSAAVRADASALTVLVEHFPVRLVDRRLVGADWLHAPNPPAGPPPRVVFASLKGGVGRSTALAIVAAHLAGRGCRVLAVDLDMEAPGLGAMLLTKETVPEFGMLDALVENGLTGLDETFYADLIGASELAGKRGRIDVIPAFGRRSLENPADVLAKIARAYAEDVRQDGSVATLLEQVRAIVERCADPERYDAVLIDARAGLHESTASAVLGLGAEVLLFGLDEAQTFQGYKAMLAHLARFLSPTAKTPEWLERLTIVQGKAPIDAEERASFVQSCHELFIAAGIVTAPEAAVNEVVLPAGPFGDVPWDEELSDDAVLPAASPVPDPLAILYDARFQRFEPLGRRDLLSEAVYRATFGALIEWIDALVMSGDATSAGGDA
ncbi:ParA family protein [Polyangium mundeleinium]|uniref:AAA family ATPase n=1 Tax=Polyangium mundeleinium TaxID=2995306 RepID=A0ABT5F8V0_9BACT|nr:AAA family ATPase [Polyangium mundeleinium]MDC0749592.1 AAA family ATPase [Polyangium mundeleinium]